MTNIIMAASRPKLLAMHSFIPSTIRRYPGQVWQWSLERDVSELPVVLEGKQNDFGV
jgi:hypothetical protein